METTITMTERLVTIYKAFGSIPRLKILLALVEGEKSASDLSTIALISQSATSQHLKELRLCDIIRSRKEGMHVFYRLSDEHIEKMLLLGLEHVKGENCNA